MLVRKLDQEKFVQAYGVDLQMLYPWEGVVEPPFGAAWAVLAPGKSTKHHNHQEGETFFVARGHGVMTVDGESVPVEAGDVVFQQPFHEHTLSNTSDDDLLFLTVWWEDRALWEGAEVKEAAAAPESRASRVLVTAAPPTPNGELHVGHLSGPYLGADLHTRYRRLRGDEAYYACGSDDNSVYVPFKAAQLGEDVDTVIERYVSGIEAVIAKAQLGMDVFVHPNASPHHRALTTEFFETLWRGGKLVEREALAPFCPDTGQYLFEPFVAGGCPRCGAGVVGNICEDCGMVNDAVNLAEPTATGSGKSPEMRTVKRIVFPLSEHADFLAEYHKGVAMRPRLRAFCEEMIARGLPDVAVTHPTDWGIPVPVAGYEDQRIFVWLEMAPRYFAYSRHVNEKAGIEGDWHRFWRAPEAEVVQFYGFDNSFYYALMLPAMFHAFDPDIRLPTAFVTNEFYRLDGLKFSTSRGHAIWGREILEEASSDAVRYHLASTSPETEGTNFTREDFEATLDRELVRGWCGWLEDLGRRLEEDFEGQVPATGDWTPDHQRFYRRLEALVADGATAYEAATFSPQLAARTVSELVRAARRFGQAELHWSRSPERSQELRTGMALEVLAAKLLAILSWPLMPSFAERLWSDLGFESPLGDGAWESRPEWVPGGQKVGSLAGPYFA